MFQRVLILGVFVLLGSTLAAPQLTSAQSNEGADALACSAASTERIVLTQPQILLSHDEGGAFIGPELVSIPAGIYNLTTTSYEEHIGTNDPTQDSETWYFEGYFHNAVVYTSPTTTDIPDDIDTVSDDFGRVTLPEIDAVRWVHSAFPDPTYQSVYASCIEFEVVDTAVDTSCTVSLTAQQLKVTAETSVSPAGAIDEITYDWGDNSVETLPVTQVAMHTYTKQGSYSVTATTNNLTGGQVARCATAITVDESGAVLGENTDTDTAIEVVDDTAEILGATTEGEVLANTGSPAALQLLVGSGIAATAIAAKRST